LVGKLLAAHFALNRRKWLDGNVALDMVCQLFSVQAAFATISTKERPIVFVNLHVELELHGGGENDLAPSMTA
jgi:hypothetical protein